MNELNLLTDVYYYNREQQCWKPSFVISKIKEKNHVVVASYGPSLPAKHVLTADEYIDMIRDNQLADYTDKIKEAK
jgi:hypothetical protein